MKLEVGQKIGIYEALCRFITIENGKYYIGIDDDVDETGGAFLYSKESKSYSIFMTRKEVRKVGSLIVKRLK